MVCSRCFTTHETCWLIDTNVKSNGFIFLDTIDSKILGIIESREIG